LITARLGLLREARGDTSEYYMSQQSDRPSRYKATTFNVNVTTHTDYVEDTKVEAVEDKTGQAEIA
jgi:hypothetical protein